ncbi:MAG: hypothetical protein DSZ35_11980 [Verrucomicrobia bacterium]|nr:MAG: hypothetical protein DSZ35_11980 [Verrucomicrobiota bacterium]
MLQILTRSTRTEKLDTDFTDFHGLFFSVQNRVNLRAISFLVSFVLFVVGRSHYEAGRLFQSGAENRTPGRSANAKPWQGGEALNLIFGKL